MFFKKVFLEISQNSQDNTCAREVFLNKVTSPTLLKYRLGTGVFIFSWNTSGGCFCTGCIYLREVDAQNRMLLEFNLMSQFRLHNCPIMTIRKIKPVMFVLFTCRERVEQMDWFCVFVNVTLLLNWGINKGK